MPASSAIGHAAMLAFSALVAFSFTFGSLIAHQIDPTVLTTIRFVVALIVMSTIAVFTSVNFRRLFRDLWRWLIIGGCMAAYFNLMFVALRHTTPLATSAVFTLTPLLAAGFGYVLLGITTGRTTFLALITGAIGALWVIFKGSWEAALSLDFGTGEAIFLIGAIAHAAVPALRLKLVPNSTAFEAALGTIFGALIVTLFFAAPELVHVVWGEVSNAVWLFAIYLGVGATAATFFLLQVAVKRLPPGKVMAYTYLIPAWVVLHGAVMGQSEKPILYVAVALILSALFVLLFSEENQAKTDQGSESGN